jgi:hypothetical protein
MKDNSRRRLYLPELVRKLSHPLESCATTKRTGIVYVSPENLVLERNP